MQDYTHSLPFELPFNFSQKVNDLDKYLTKFDSALGDQQREKHFRAALSTACEILSEINKNSLEASIQNIADASEVEKVKQIIEQNHNFRFFLDKIEDGILAEAKISATARQRILRLLEDARPEAIFIIQRSPNSSRNTAKQITESIEELSRELNEMKKEVRFNHNKQRDRLIQHTRVVNTFGVVVAVTNTCAVVAVAGSLTSIPSISIAAANVSIALGTAAMNIKPRVD